MNGENLDVIVLTYNRCNYLKIQLESLCNQTLKGFRIVVLNNCSTDNTLDVVQHIKSKYPDREIIVKTNSTNLGNPGNFQMSQKIPERKYVAVFHDDDAVHPEYLELVMQIFSMDDGIVMVSCASDVRYNVTNNDWLAGLNKDVYVFPINSAYQQLLCSRPNFATCVYRTNVYKKSTYHPELYGKLHDICFILDVCQYGKIAISCAYGLRYRKHSGSDSQNYKTGPFKNEVINVIGYLKHLIPNSEVNSALLWNFCFFLYKWSKINEYMEWKEFISNPIVDLEAIKSFHGNEFDRIIFSQKEIIKFGDKNIIDRINRNIIKLANKECNKYLYNVEKGKITFGRSILSRFHNVIDFIK